MKKILFTALFILIVHQLFPQTVLKTMMRLPDTGVNSGYTVTFGEDNDYNIHQPYFIIHANGTLTDSITGLMWQQTDGGEMTIDNAVIYCDTLTLAGYNDWRLPDAHEAFSVLNLQYANPALDTLVFTKSQAQYWWTSSRQANDTNKIWVTNSGGGIGNHPRTETISAGGTKRMHVRAVRDVITPQTIPAHFNDNGDGTITDNLTDLTWQKIPYSDTLTWEDALSYADTLTFSGFTDWRLPNIKELQSINSENIHHPSLNTNFFNVLSGQIFWSSTTLRNQNTKAWYLDNQFGITTYDIKTNKHFLICVRGNPLITSIQEAINQSNGVYPNPFKTKIALRHCSGKEYYELMNAEGRTIYSGTKVQDQDFSFLMNGVYLLKVVTDSISVFRLLKY